MRIGKCTQTGAQARGANWRRISAAADHGHVSRGEAALSQYLLHTHRARALRKQMLLRADARLTIASVPWRIVADRFA